MLMLAIHCTLQRMERQLYSGQWTHVREDPVQHRHRPLSWLEQLVNDAFLRLQGVDLDAEPIPMDDFPTIPLCPIHEARLQDALSQ